MSTLILCVIFSIPIAILIVCAIVALGKKPGLRRRKGDVYDGVERRCKRRPKCLFGQNCKSADKCLYARIDESVVVNTDALNKETTCPSSKTSCH